MTLIAIAVLGALIAAPHLLDLRLLAPVTAAVIWLSALALRAALILGAAVYLTLFLPATQLFVAGTHWCWHAVLPLVSAHLGLSGHRVADAAVVVPVLVLVVSGASAAFGVIRAARAVASLVRREALGAGPQGTVIVGSPEVILAAAGVRRPQVVVSAGALTALDDEELAAGLEHERAHVHRRHRFVLVIAELCRAFARFLPGTPRAMRELRFHLERDADACALRSHDRLALASAICKAAGAPSGTSAAVHLGARSGIGERLRQIVDAPVMVDRGAKALATRMLAAVMVTAVVAVTAAIPTAVAAGGAPHALHGQVRHCQT